MPLFFIKLNSSLNKSLNINTRVDISSYNSLTNCYTIPTDGYLYMYTNLSSRNEICLVNKGGITSAIASNVTGSQYGGSMSLFIKKGMKIFYRTTTGSGQLYYLPLETV